MTKIPANLFPTGSSVACRNPQPGAVAHRPETVSREIPGRTFQGKPMTEQVSVAACDQKGPAVPLVTAHWADHRGAVACTEPACFPTA